MENPVFAGRYRAEEIMQVECPACRAQPQRFCDRRGDWLSPAGRALAAAGTPPSHQERMWLRQGHSPREFPALRAKIQPGKWPQRLSSASLAMLAAEARKVTAGPPPPGTPRWKLRRYTSQRICPGCRVKREVEVRVAAPWTIAYRCPCGHRWLITAPKPVSPRARPTL